MMHRTFIALTLASFLVAACTRRVPGTINTHQNDNTNQNHNTNRNDNTNHAPPTFSFSQTMHDSDRPAVDLLFVLDNSDTMANEQQTLSDQFPVMIERITKAMGGMPDLHVGVVTTDLGAGSYTDLGGCRQVGGDQGILGMAENTNRSEFCIGTGQRYLVDESPKGCTIQVDAPGSCTSDACTQIDCDAMAVNGEILALVHDDNGCPRCVNYQGTLVNAFDCMSHVGTQGCGFEQPLEAMKKALDLNDTPQNQGFLRDAALLGVVLLSDEDDCSASDPDTLFNPDPNLNTMTSSLGFLTSFRCFEFGVTCDVNDRTVVGPRQNCSPREDHDALLYHPSRYTAFLESIKDPSHLRVMALSGPITPVNVTLDSQQRPLLDHSCQDPAVPNEGAAPAIRTHAVVAHFYDQADLDAWAFSSICSTDFSAPIEGLGQSLKQAAEALACLDHPVAGCSHGTAGSDCLACLPRCSITLQTDPGTNNQKTYEVPWCGALCLSGICTKSDLQPCNEDASGRCQCFVGWTSTRLDDGTKGCGQLFYPQGPEVRVDSTVANVLPVQEPTCTGTSCSADQAGRASACWSLVDQPNCAGASAMTLVVSDPDLLHGTLLSGTCETVPTTETSCSDGRDDDEDCLVDHRDPDCAP